MHNTDDVEKQVTLRNKDTNLKEGSVLADFASKMKDDYEVTLTPKETKKLVSYIGRLKTGFQASMPILCIGEQCPYAKKCPLGENNNYPMGRECPMENYLKDSWYADYATELEISSESKIDSSLVQDLVLWDMLSKRALEELSSDPKIVKRSVAGFQQTEDGLSPVYKDELNQKLTFLEKAQRNKMKIMDSLIATREAKSKDTSRLIHDPSSYAAKLLDKARELKEKAAQAGLVEVDYSVEDQDAKESDK